MISSTSEYAIRAVIHLGAHPGEAVAARDIAAATGVPPGYLPKILQELVHAGMVSSRRGPRGGFTLARDPSALRLSDVVDAVEPARRERPCPLAESSGEGGCCYHRRMGEARRVVERILHESRVSDFIDGTAPGPPCPFARRTTSGSTVGPTGADTPSSHRPRRRRADG